MLWMPDLKRKYIDTGSLYWYWYFFVWEQEQFCVGYQHFFSAKSAMPRAWPWR